MLMYVYKIECSRQDAQILFQNMLPISPNKAPNVADDQGRRQAAVSISRWQVRLDLPSPAVN